MNRLFTLCRTLALVCAAAGAVPAYAQVGASAQPVIRIAALAQSDLHGVVVDDRGQPVAGAVVSALGTTSAFAVSGRDGHFSFRNLPSGPYLVRAHLQGYLPVRGRMIQASATIHDISTITLTRRAEDGAPGEVLAAGVGPSDVSTGTAIPAADGDDHGEVAWRLRHLKRGVLKDESTGLIDLGHAASFQEDPVAAFTRAAATSARFASALFTELPVNGQFNLLTRTSLARPQDLFAADSWMPSGVAYLVLQASTAGGEWSMRSAVTQGDLSSWILAGSYVRDTASPHQFEGGLSYGMQRYLGGNADALAAVSDGSRNVGAVYGYDNWTIDSRVRLGFGAKYARYDYLGDSGQLSPRASVTIAPMGNAALTVRALVSRRALVPGEEEFLPPATGLWLPPERTFSPLSARRGFTAEQVDHVEVGAEHQWAGDFVIGVRAFRQVVDDQLVTVFGSAAPGTASASLGHYYVASGGSLEARGWGVGVSRSMTDGLRASVDYTEVESVWLRPSPDEAALASVAGSLLRTSHDLFHDLTTSIESVVPITATRVFLVYKINSALAGDAGSSVPHAGARFDVQIRQSLPFLQFTSAQWEMLIAVRTLFREDMVGASVYDELLVMRAPKRVVGGVTVRF